MAHVDMNADRLLAVLEVRLGQIDASSFHQTDHGRSRENIRFQLPGTHLQGGYVALSSTYPGRYFVVHTVNIGESAICAQERCVRPRFSCYELKNCQGAIHAFTLPRAS